jgi:hypothetical protein
MGSGRIGGWEPSWEPTPNLQRKMSRLGGTGQVLAALELAQHARRAILVIPLFAGTDYAKRITERGGRIVCLAPACTWSIVPDNFLKEGTVRKHVGHIQHPAAVEVFHCNQYHPEGEDNWDERPFVRTVEAWWVACAPGKEATTVRGKRSEDAQGSPWFRWYDTDRQREAEWGWGRDSRGGNGAWRRSGVWDPEIGGLEHAPPGFRTC